MNKKIKGILTIALISILIISTTACGKKIDTMKRIDEGKKIVWGTSANFPPFELKEGTDVVGIDADVAQKIADKLGVELIVEDMEFEALPAALESGKVDFIAAGFTRNSRREKTMDFTKTYFEAVQSIIVQNENEDIKGTDDLVGKRIGVQTGTTGDTEVASNTEDADVKRYNTGLEAILDLKNGNLDAVVIDDLPAQMLIAQNSEVKILDEKAGDQEEYAIAVRKGDSELLQAIDEVLKELQDSGEMDEIISKYYIK